LAVAVAVVAASGEEAGFLDEVKGAGASSKELASGSVVALLASALAVIALTVVAAVDVEAEVLGLASVAQEANGARAFSLNA
jgi:hypothetical protein